MGEDHENTADSYFDLGVSQCVLKDYTSATESHKRALKIKQKVSVEDHENAADSYLNLEVTQYIVRDYTSSAESQTRALNIRRKVLGQDHEKTADNLGITQVKFGDHTLASDFDKPGVEIKQKASGDIMKHSSQLP